MNEVNLNSKEKILIEKINQQKDQEIRFDINTLNETNFKRILKYFNDISLSPAEYLIGGLLAAMSGAVGKKVCLELTKTIRVYPNLWIILIGRSTIMRKTSAINLCTESLMRMEDHYYNEYLKQLSNIEKETSNQKEKNSNNNSKPKRNYVLLPQDATIESLTEILSISKQGLLIHNEFGAFLNQFNKSYQSDGKQFFTNIYDVPERYEVSRITREGKVLKRPYIAILGASTIDWVREFSSETDIKSGFFARFLYIIRNNNDKPYIPLLELRHRTRESKFYINAGEIFKYLLELPEDVEVEFDIDAEKKLNDYDENSYKELLLCEDENELSFKARLLISVFKIAMLIALSDKKVKEKTLLIELKDAEDAINLADNLFKPNIEKLLNKELKSNELIRNKEKVLRVIKLKGSLVSRSDLMNTTGFSAKELDEIILNLEQKEKIITEQKINPKNNKKRIFYSLIS